ncbi:alpha/beta hydrolase [Flavobacteriaceae bacterium TK19130]|nr:alpha/beta hydrolase [Thermobacterium salinum]
MISTYRDCDIHYTVSGKGPAIVLLHGFLESSTIWNEFVTHLSETKTVITIDLPGHGKSDVFGHVHTMEEMANVVVHIMDECEISAATMLGHSMGGYVALAMAEAYPERISRLLLLNSTTLPDSEERLVNRNRALQLLDENPPPFIRMAIANLFPSERIHDYEEIIVRLKNEALSFPLEGIKACIRGMMQRKDQTETLRRFSNEKLWIAGKSDPLISLTLSKELAKKSKAPLKIIDGGHMGWIENKNEVLLICI